MEAAGRVGISITDLWSRFEGVQHTREGKPVKTVFKGGVFRPRSEFGSLDKLSIGATEGKIDPRELRHLRAQLTKKVRAKQFNLSAEQISAEIDSLLKDMEASPDQTHYNPVIREGFKPSSLDSKVIVSVESRPWETEWGLAKIVFELSNTVLTAPYRKYFAEVIQTVRAFFERRECSPDGKQGVGIFRYTALPASNAARCHVIEGRLNPFKCEWHLTFFGTARWSFAVNVRPIRAPGQSQRIFIENPTDNGDGSLRVEMSPPQ